MTSIDVAAPGVDISIIDLDIALDTGADTLQISGSASLVVLGQSITATFDIAETGRNTADHMTRISFTGGSMTMQLPNGDIVASVSGASGDILATPAGVAADLGATATFGSGVGITSTAITIRLNTFEVRIDDTFEGSAGPVTLSLPAGPYLQLTALGATATFTAGGSSPAFVADFTFDQSERDDGNGGTETITRIAIADASISNGTAGLNNGFGAILITNDGIAGFITGTATSGAFTGDLGVRFNNTGEAVNELLEFGDRSLAIIFTTDADVFSFFGSDLHLQIGDFITIEGDVTFETINGEEVFGANNALIFLGRGPLRLDPNSAAENPNAVGVVLRNARIGVIKTAAGDFAVSAAGSIEVVGVAGVTISGSATVDFNNTPADVSQSITFTASDGSTDSVFVEAEVGDRSFQATNVVLQALGQRLTGDFGFDVTTAGTKQVTVSFANVSLALGDGSTDVVAITGADGMFVLNEDGLVGTAAVDGAGQPDTDGVQLNLGTGATQTIDAISLEIDTTDAGPFLRLAVTGASLNLGGLALVGDFTFERAADAEGATTVAVGLNNALGQIATSDGNATLTISDASGAFFITTAGVVGQATADVTLSTPGDVLTLANGTFLLMLNTTGTAVDTSIVVGNETINVVVPAGPFIRIEASDIDLELTVGGVTQTLEGNALIEKSTTDSGDVLIIEVSDLRMDFEGVLTVTDGQLQLVVTDTGVAADGVATVDVDVPGITIAGTYGILANTHETPQDLPFDVPVGPLFSFLALGALISVAGFEITARRLLFTSDAPNKVTLAGEGGGFTLRANGKRVIGLQEADFGFEISDDGLIGALLNGEILGPDFGGDFELGGVVAFAIDTTGTGGVVDVTVDFLADGTPVTEAVTIAADERKVAVTEATINIVGTTLSAGSLTFTQLDDGAIVQLTGTDVDAELAVAGTRIVRIDDASFDVTVTDRGVFGVVAEAQVTGPNLPGIALDDAVVSLQINTLSTSQTVTVNAETVTLPGAPLGSPFVRFEVTGDTPGGTAKLTVLGAEFSAERLSFERSGNTVVVDGQGVGLSLQAGGVRVIEIQDADIGFVFSPDGVAAAVLDAEFQGPAAAGISIGGVDTRASVLVNTSDQAATIDVAGAPVAIAAGPFVQVRIADAELTALTTQLSADLWTFEYDGDTDSVSVGATDLGVVLAVGDTQILSLADADFAARFTAEGLVAATVNGTFTGPGQSLSTPTATNAAFDAISFEGTVGIAVNTTGAAAQLDIVTDILDDGTEVIDTVDIAGEIGTTYARVDIADATLTVLDNVLTADRLSFAKSGANIDVSGVNLDLAINAGTTRVLGLANADFALRFTEDGVAGALRNADVLGPDLGDEFEISGTVSAEFNTTNTDQTLDIDSTPVLVVAGTGDYVRGTVTDPVLSIAGVTIEASAVGFEVAAGDVGLLDPTTDPDTRFNRNAAFDPLVGPEGLDLSAPRVVVTVSDLAVSIGEPIRITTATDSTLVIVSDGVLADINGLTVTVAGAPDFAIAGTFNLAIDTTSPSPSVRLEVTDATVIAAGQELEGNFVFERFEDAQGDEVVRVVVSELAVTIAADGEDLFVVSDGSGFLILTDLGVAGAFEVSAAFGSTVNGFSLTLDQVMIEINTTPVAINQTVTIEGQDIEIATEAGPFVRIVVVGGTLTAGQSVELTGNFTFEQQGAPGSRITVVAFSDVTLEIDPDPTDGDTALLQITNGNGVFVFDELGFAGILSGDVAVEVGPFGAGGSVGLRINTRVEGIDTTVTVGGEEVAITFENATPNVVGSGEVADVNGPFVNVFGASVNLVIADFVSIEADLAFSGSTLTGENVTMFIGDGPLFLEDADGNRDTTKVNPLAVGLKITNAGFSVTKAGTAANRTWLMLVFGDIELVGVTDVQLEGTVSVAINTTGAEAPSPLPARTEPIADGTVEVSGSALTLKLGPDGPDQQALTGSFVFTKAADGTIIMTFVDVGLNLGSGALTLTEGVGSLRVGSTGIAGKVEVKAAAALPGITLVNAKFTLSINTTETAIAETIDLGDGTTLAINLPQGPYVRVDIVSADGVNQPSIDVLNQRLSGTFAIEVTTSQETGGGTIVILAARNVTAAFGDGTNDFVTFTGGKGFFVFDNVDGGDGTGTAGTIEGFVSAAIPSAENSVVSFEGRLSVEFNTRNIEIDESIIVDGAIEELNFAAGPAFIRIHGENVVLKIADQRIAGTFTIQKTTAGTDTVLAIAVSDGALRLGDGTTDIVTASQDGAGAVLIRRGTSANELAGTFAASISVSIPGVSFDGSAAVSFNTSATEVTDVNIALAGDQTVAAGPYVRAVLSASGTGEGLTVQGATLQGTFGFESRTNTDGTTKLTIVVDNAVLGLGSDGANPLVTFTGNDGLFVIDNTGLAGTISVGVAVAGGDVTVAGGDISIQINTFTSAVTEMFDLTPDDDTDDDIVLSVPAGPFVQVRAIGVTLEAVDQKLTGDLLFRSQGGNVAIAASNVFARFGTADVAVVFSEGAGALLLTANGLAGAIRGAVSLEGVEGVTLNAVMSLQFKNYNDGISLEMVDGSRVALPTGEFFKVEGDVAIDVVDAFVVEGVFSITANATPGPSDPDFVIDATGVSIFVGVPDQLGVRVSNAAFHLDVTQADAGTDADFNVEVTGTVSLVGLPAGITIGGTVTASVSSTGSGVDRVLDMVIAGDPLEINTPLGAFEGSLFFTRDGASGDVMVSGTGISYFIGKTTSPQLGFAVDNADFGLVIKTDRTYAFTLTGAVSTALPGGINVTGNLAASFNSAAIDLDVVIGTGATATTVPVPAGSLSVGGDLTFTLAAPAVELSGSFLIEFDGNGPDGIPGSTDDVDELFVAGSGIAIEVKAGPGNTIGFEVADANLALLITPDGFAVDARGAVRLVGVPTVEVTGIFGVQVSTLAEPVARSFTIDGATKSLAMAAGTQRFGGDNIVLTVAGQTLSGDFTVDLTGGIIDVAIENAHFGLGTLDREFIAIDGDAQLLIDSNGLGATVAGTVTADIPGVELAAAVALEVEINTTGQAIAALGLDAGTYVRVRGDVDLRIAGQTLTGRFTFEQITTDGGDQVVKVAATGVTIDLDVVQVTNASGALLINAMGVAGELTLSAALNLDAIPGLTATGTAKVQVNTTPVAIDETFTFTGGDTFELTLPAGQYLRVEVTIPTNGLQLDIGGGVGSISASGTLALERITRDDGTQITLIGITDFTAEVDVASNIATVTNGQGALAVVDTGIAGIISGEVDIAVGPVGAGGTVTVRLNTSGVAVDEIIEIDGRSLPIRFGAGEGNVFQVSVSGLSLNIGDFVTIEGDVTFNGDTFAGTNLEVFLGQGPARLDTGEINPLATGVLLTDATIALRKGSVADTYALSATGTIQVVGVEGVTIAGTASVRFNNTGIDTDELITIPGSDSDVVLRVLDGAAIFEGTNLVIDVLGQSLSGDLAFSKQLGDAGTIVVSAANISMDIGDGAVSLTNGAGTLVITGAGLAAEISATVALNIPDASFGGNLGLAINTTGVAVVTEGLDLVAGPYFRLEADPITLTIGGQELSGSFAIEQLTTPAGISITRINASNITATLGPVSLSGGTGNFLITPGGIAGRLSGSVGITVPGLDTLDADFSFAVSTLSLPVAETFRVDGIDVDLDLPAGPFLKFEAPEVTISIGGQLISGTFGFERVTLTSGAPSIALGVLDGTIELGVPGASIGLTNISGSLLIESNGLAGRLGGTLAVDLSGVAVSGDVSVEFNQTGLAIDQSFLVGGTEVALLLDAGPYARLAVRNASLDVFGQTLAGDFVFEQNGAGIAVGATNVELDLGDGLVTIGGGTGLFAITTDGFAGSFSGAVAIDAEGVSIGADLTVEINATGKVINQTIGTETLNLPAGQFVRVVGTGIQLDVFGQSLTANLIFEQATTATGASIVRLGFAGVAMQLTADGTTIVDVTSGQGGLLISDAGIAGSISVTAALTIPGIDGIAASVGNVTVEFNGQRAPVVDSFIVPVPGGTTNRRPRPARRHLLPSVDRRSCGPDLRYRSQRRLQHLAVLNGYRRDHYCSRYRRFHRHGRRTLYHRRRRRLPDHPCWPGWYYLRIIRR